MCCPVPTRHRRIVCSTGNIFAPSGDCALKLDRSPRAGRSWDDPKATRRDRRAATAKCTCSTGFAGRRQRRQPRSDRPSSWLHLSSGASPKRSNTCALRAAKPRRCAATPWRRRGVRDAQRQVVRHERIRAAANSQGQSRRDGDRTTTTPPATCGRRCAGRSHAAATAEPCFWAPRGL